MLTSEQIANLLINNKISQAGYETIEADAKRSEVISAYRKIDVESCDRLKDIIIDLYNSSCDVEVAERINTEKWVSRYSDPIKRTGSAWKMIMLTHTSGRGILGINNNDQRVQSILSDGVKVYERQPA